MRFSHVSLIALGALAVVACSDQNGGAVGQASQPASAPANAAATKVMSPYLGGKSAAATAPRPGLRTPAALDAATIQQLQQRGRYERTNAMSEDAKNDVHHHRVHSVPHFHGSYSLAGTTYDYTMVGDEPQEGGTTWVKNTILPVSLVFDEWADASGAPLRVDATSMAKQMAQSPNWERAKYGTGFTQFSDAVQRAEFWNVMGDGWHTMLEHPRMQKGITLEVPVGQSIVFQAPDGAWLTLIDINFFNSQFNTIMQMMDTSPNELAIVVTPNVFVTDISNPSAFGYILGWHFAFDAQNPDSFVPDPATAKYVQTIAWSSWVEQGIFGNFSDVTGLSHEIAEWMNDPFIDNATENWSFPGIPTACQNNLETGDPVEVLPNSSYPVTLHGYTYHPQTEALLQWFSQETPSSAFQGAYSYPDTTALPGPSQTCAPTPPPPPPAPSADGG